MNEHKGTIATGTLLGLQCIWIECSCGRIGAAALTESNAWDDQERHVTGRLR